MNKNLVRILGLLLALAGLVVLLSMPSLADSAGSAIMARNGGSMDTNVYLADREAAVAAYRLIGAALLAVGLFRATEPDRN
jgi:hypothetical protein